MQSVDYRLTLTKNCEQNNAFCNRLHVVMKSLCADQAPVTGADQFCGYPVGYRISSTMDQMTLSSADSEEAAFRRVQALLKKELGAIPLQFGGTPISQWPSMYRISGFINTFDEITRQKIVRAILLDQLLLRQEIDFTFGDARVQFMRFSHQRDFCKALRKAHGTHTYLVTPCISPPPAKTASPPKIIGSTDSASYSANPRGAVVSLSAYRAAQGRKFAATPR